MLVILLIMLISSISLGKPDTERVGAIVYPSERTVTIPQNAVEVAPNVFSLGTVSVNGEELEGYMFVHYKKDFVRSGQNSKPARNLCYSFLSSGARWKDTESYLVEYANDDGLTQSFVESVVAESLEAWDLQTPFEIFGSQASGEIDGVDTSAPDTKNEILFGSVSDSGVIAVTTVWGIFGGSPKSRKLVEFDALFNDADFTWGDVSTTGNLSLMDFKNIAVHEFGHAAGMGHPSNSCTEETMYAYASEGETKKRDLNSGDIAGIISLYK